MNKLKDVANCLTKIQMNYSNFILDFYNILNFVYLFILILS